VADYEKKINRVANVMTLTPYVRPVDELVLHEGFEKTKSN
jgi:hypothetical protein